MMKRRNSTRDRVTAELRALRLLAQDLEARVLKFPQPPTSRDVHRLWQRLAERQRHACAASQRENARLLYEVQRSADWIERLWVLLRETRRIDWTREAQRNARALDAAVLAQLKRDVALRTTWASALKAFQAHGLSLCASHDSPNDRWSRSIDDAIDRRCSLVFERHLPFDALATSDALWSALAAVGDTVTRQSDDNCASGQTVVLERSQTACAMKYEIDGSLVLGDDKPVIRCYAIIQTVVARGSKADDTLLASGATLFAWHSVSSASSRTHTASARDTMWVAVSTSASGGSTVSIVAETQLDESPSDMPRLLESMLRASESCVSQTLETAENALMDASLSRHMGIRMDESIAEKCSV